MDYMANIILIQQAVKAYRTKSKHTVLYLNNIIMVKRSSGYILKYTYYIDNSFLIEVQSGRTGPRMCSTQHK